VELGNNIEIDRHKIQLERPIKESGAQEVLIRLHPDVTAKLNVIVKSKGADEAGKAEGEEGAAEERGAGGYKAKVKAKHTK
jgi:large subunit ribosomal protein L9